MPTLFIVVFMVGYMGHELFPELFKKGLDYPVVITFTLLFILNEVSTIRKLLEYKKEGK